MACDPGRMSRQPNGAFTRTRGTCVLVPGFAILGPLCAAAAGSANFEGTWRIAAPEGWFKPYKDVVPFTADGPRPYLENRRSQPARNFDA